MEQLGISPTFLLAQIVNFVVLWVILQRFLFPPVLKTLEARRNRIRDSLAEAERMKEQNASARREFEQQLAEERRKGAEIAAQAARDAEQIREQIVARAREEAEQILADARAQASVERDQMLADLRRQVADLSILGAQRIIGKTLDQQTQRQLIQDFLTQSGELS